MTTDQFERNKRSGNWKHRPIIECKESKIGQVSRLPDSEICPFPILTTKNHVVLPGASKTKTRQGQESYSNSHCNLRSIRQLLLSSGCIFLLGVYPFLSIFL